eukprot:12755931-Alexandrium_andersonii.AAC.1
MIRSVSTGCAASAGSACRRRWRCSTQAMRSGAAWGCAGPGWNRCSPSSGLDWAPSTAPAANNAATFTWSGSSTT